MTGLEIFCLLIIGAFATFILLIAVSFLKAF